MSSSDFWNNVADNYKYETDMQSESANNLSKKVVIIGAGISGATAARELAKKLKMNPNDIVVLEKNNYLGGKLKTYTYPPDPRIKAEYGAGVLTHNYGIVDSMVEKGIALEKLLPVDQKTVNFSAEINKQPLWKKITYLCDFTWQAIKFALHVRSYNQAHCQFKDAPPAEQEKPFMDFIEQKKLDKVATFLEFLVPGFGYGTYKDKNNYAYRILNYMGYTTIPSIAFANSLKAVHGGYQQVVEKMLEGFDVKTSVDIKHIERKEGKTTIQFEQNGQIHKLDADLLILAMSPYYWKDLGMKLTPKEEKCVNQLAYYPYPVVICRIKGLPPEQIYDLDALEPEKYGHAAFLFTRDNRKNPEDGRLYGVYINLPQGKNHYQFNDQTKAELIKDLKQLPGVTDVAIEDGVIWPDYNPSVPWETGIKLQKEEIQNGLNTIHLGTYMPGGFETVAGAEEYARKTIDRWFHVQDSKLKETFNHVRRAYQFFTMPRKEPIKDRLPEENLNALKIL